MIERWNQKVKPQDTVYHLGDFAFRKKVDREAYLKKLNGKIIKLWGNHDPANWGEKYLEFKQNGLRVVLCHFPFEEWNGYFRDSIHLHCHTHAKEFVSAERRGNAGVDATGFTPISLDEAVDRLMPGKHF